MTLTELQNSLAFWKAAYDAAAKGELLQWEGRSFRPRPPDVCMQQIQLLERRIAMVQVGRQGHNYSLAKLS